MFVLKESKRLVKQLCKERPQSFQFISSDLQ
jgi:hypothetical protein